MIYSENFSQEIEKEKECLTFTTLDDNFLPFDTDDDFVPRYIRDDDRLSWLSDGSVIDNVQLDFSVPNANNQNHGTFSDEESDQTQEVDRRSQMSGSPFYWNIESYSPYPTDTPVPTLTLSPLPPNVYRQHSNAIITILT